MSIYNINPDEPGLDQCNDKSPFREDLNLDQPPPYCHPDQEPNRRQPNDDSLNWLKDQMRQKTGLGASALCDPMQTGDIVNDLTNPQRNTIYRYSKSIRGTDEAMLDLFRNVVVLDEDAKAHRVPIIFGSQERAVAVVYQDNVRKDETLVVNRIRLPLMALSQSQITYNLRRYVYHKALDYMTYYRSDGKPGFTLKEKYDRDTVFGVARGIPVDIGYTLYVWTMYIEDMNQILEQILSKFSQTAYIRVTGIPWEIIVKLDGTGTNLNLEPGDQALRVIKYQINMTVETYIPQPIKRQKAVLKTKIDFVDSLDEDKVTEVLARLEEAVKELEC